MVAPVPKEWVEVVFPHPPLSSFTYSVPPKFSGALKAGCRVVVPLGKRRTTGFVTGFAGRPEIEGIRDIEDVLDSEPLLPPLLMELTRWVADYYFSGWGEAIRSALPPGIYASSRLLVRRTALSPAPEFSLSPLERNLLVLIGEKGADAGALEKKLNSGRIGYALACLEKKGLVSTERRMKDPRAQSVSRRWVSLAQDPDEETLLRLRKKAPRQAEALEALLSMGGELPRSELDAENAALRRLEEQGFITLFEEAWDRNPYRDVPITAPAPVRLTADQENVLSSILPDAGQSFRVFLLHGVTSSGKTQVYIETLRKVLESGKSALVLIPEISLTPQAVERYCGAFGEDVAVLHSRLSPGERYDSWRKLRNGRCRIALGPRSAVFAPLANLGIIIVDEEHDASYKQMDPAPRYQARDVAVMRGRLSGCTVLLGSATPSLESYTNALSGKFTLCRLPSRVDYVPMPLVTLTERARTGSAPAGEVIGPELLEKMKACLDRGGQVILLQNRRGYASFLRCAACGHIEMCPHCDITLTYHRKGLRLRCHYCGFHKAAPSACESCGGAALYYHGTGTQRVEEEVKSLFPGVELMRMDQDTTRRKGAHDRLVTGFGRSSGNILLGTQMVAKGHDFPRVELVGVISADTGLFFPDFRSGEKTFQLLTQAAGRSGRRERRGEVVIQTFQPDHPVLRLAAGHNFEAFYRLESEERKELLYPPWGRLILIRFTGAPARRVEEAAEHFRFCFQEPSFQVLGPAYSPLSRIKSMHRMQILLKSGKESDPSGSRMRAALRKCLARYSETGRFPQVKVQVDVDPMEVM